MVVGKLIMEFAPVQIPLFGIWLVIRWDRGFGLWLGIDKWFYVDIFWLQNNVPWRLDNSDVKAAFCLWNVPCRGRATLGLDFPVSVVELVTVSHTNTISILVTRTRSWNGLILLYISIYYLFYLTFPPLNCPLKTSVVTRCLCSFSHFTPTKWCVIPNLGKEEGKVWNMKRFLQTVK